MGRDVLVLNMMQLVNDGFLFGYVFILMRYMHISCQRQIKYAGFDIQWKRRYMPSFAA